MKKLLFFLYFVSSSMLLLSQERDTVKTQSPDIIKNTLKKKDSTNSSYVPFAKIEHVPIFPKCEKLDTSLQRMCLQNQIKWHVAKKYNTRLADKLGLTRGNKRVYVIFTIDKNGNVIDIKARGPHEVLEKEAIRVIQLLPQMIPGKTNGKNVDVKYTLPITLFVRGQKKKKTKR